MRDLFIEKMYELSKKPYQKFFKKGKPWDVEVNQLIQLPNDSLGFHLGCFLVKYNFEIQPKLEDHDIIHVLTNTGISVVEEIGMQYYLLGNGKTKLVFTHGYHHWNALLSYSIFVFQTINI
jgi:ubiquinone biosynthesis protein Coq4